MQAILMLLWDPHAEAAASLARRLGFESEAEPRGTGGRPVGNSQGRVRVPRAGSLSFPAPQARCGAAPVVFLPLCRAQACRDDMHVLTLSLPHRKEKRKLTDVSESGL